MNYGYGIVEQTVMFYVQPHRRERITQRLPRLDGIDWLDADLGVIAVLGIQLRTFEGDFI